MSRHIPFEDAAPHKQAARAREERHMLERDARRRGEADI